MSDKMLVDVSGGYKTTLAKPIIINENGKVYLSYKLLRPGILDKNGQAYSSQNFLEKAKTLIGKPAVLKIKTEDSNPFEKQQKGNFVHPLAHNPSGLVTYQDQVKYQQPYTVGKWVNVIPGENYEKDPYDIRFVQEVINEKYAKALLEGREEIIPPYISIYSVTPANGTDPKSNITNYEFLHGAFVDHPAFDFEYSAPRAICQGDMEQCISHLASATDTSSDVNANCPVCILEAFKDVTLHQLSLQKSFKTNDNKINHNMSSNGEGMKKPIGIGQGQNQNQNQNPNVQQQGQATLFKNNTPAANNQNKPITPNTQTHKPRLSEVARKFSEIASELKQKNELLAQTQKEKESLAERVTQIERQSKMNELAKRIPFNRQLFKDEKDYKKALELAVKRIETGIMSPEEIVEMYTNKLELLTLRSPQRNQKPIAHKASSTVDFPLSNPESSKVSGDIPTHMKLNLYFFKGGNL